MAVFVLHKAKKIHVNITKASLFNQEEGHDVMFYYMKGEKGTINFVVFDCFMRYVEINNIYIEQLQRQHPDEFKVYLNFKKKVFEEDKQDQVIDLLNNEEVESD